MKLSPRAYKLILPVVIVLLAVLLFKLLVSSKPEPKKAELKEKVWSVQAQPVELETRAPVLTVYGEVSAPDLVKASAPGAAVVAVLNVRGGDRVKQGQLLLELSQEDFLVTLRQAESERANAEAKIREARLSHKANLAALEEEKNLLQLTEKEAQRIARLRKTDLSSESALNQAQEAFRRQQLSVINRQLEVDRYPETLRQLQATLEQAKAKVDTAQLALDRSRVVAPWDLLVSSVSVAEGDQVRNGDALLSFYQESGLEVKGRLPVQFQHEVEQVLTAGNRLTAKAGVYGQQIELELLRLAGQADSSGIEAFFRIFNGAEQLRPGNLLRIELNRPEQQNVVSIPWRAIYGNDRVFRIVDERMRALKVQSFGQFTNELGEARLLIKNPQLAKGDLIVTTHLPNAVEGLKVKVVNSGASE